MFSKVHVSVRDGNRTCRGGWLCDKRKTCGEALAGKEVDQN